MAYVREGLNAHVNEYIDKQIRSSFVTANPLFYFLGMGKPESGGKLGRPKVGDAQKQETLGSTSHQIKFVKSEPNDGAAVSYGGATPTAAAFAEDNFGTAAIFWTHIMEPMKIRKHALEQAQGPTKVGSILDESMAPVWERFVKRINQGFWTGTRTQAQQNAEVWGDFLGLQHTLTNSNYYGRVDRATHTELNGNVLDADDDLTSTVADLSIIRKVNNGFTKKGGGTFTGLAARTPDGTGARCWITTSTLWNELADQADGRYQIHVNGIPDTGLGGFKNPIIHYDNSYITWDPYCPSGEMYGLYLEDWVVEVQKGHNFQWLGFTDKSKSEEGGGYYEWGNFSFQGRLTCRSPWLNVKIKDLTTA
jgi:hypothetical protein